MVDGSSSFLTHQRCWHRRAWGESRSRQGDPRPSPTGTLGDRLFDCDISCQSFPLLDRRAFLIVAIKLAKYRHQGVFSPKAPDKKGDFDHETSFLFIDADCGDRCRVNVFRKRMLRGPPASRTPGVLPLLILRHVKSSPPWSIWTLLGDFQIPARP